MKIAVIDDNTSICKKITYILSPFEEFQITTFSSIAAYEADECFYDLLLLDIELPDENGIAYIENAPVKHKLVIYISSHEEWMVDSFNPNVIGFIGKNVLEEALLPKVKKAKKYLDNMKQYDFVTMDGNIKVYENSILEIYLDYTSVYLNLQNEKKPIRLNLRSLKELENQKISDNFIKINRQTIINIQKIQQVLSKEHKVLLINGKEYAVTRGFWKDFIIRYQAKRYLYD